MPGGQGLRRQQGRAETLYDARGDQPPTRRREGRQQARADEHDDPGEEHAFAPERVTWIAKRYQSSDGLITKRWSNARGVPP